MKIKPQRQEIEISNELIKRNFNIETSFLEPEIARPVYELYGFTEVEIAVVEGV